MGSIFDIINIPLGYLFRIIYMLVGKYGWTLVLFTIVTKLILTPLTLKQHKSTMKMQKIQPKLQELQKKYQYDKEKLNQETMKLYQQGGVNPMGGCLPLLIQFPILIGLYNIIRSPLTYIVQLGKHGLPTLDEFAKLMASFGSTAPANDQIKLAADMVNYKDQLLAQFPDMMMIDFNFFGINLADTPGFTFPLIIIPIVAGLTTFLVSKISQKQMGTPPQTQAADGQQNPMQSMTYIFPFMTAFFALSLPAGLGFYWILSNLYQMAQQVVLPKVLKDDDAETEDKKEHFRERQNRRKKK